jgi:hypothetical protein
MTGMPTELGVFSLTSSNPLSGSSSWSWPSHPPAPPPWLCPWPPWPWCSSLHAILHRTPRSVSNLRDVDTSQAVRPLVVNAFGGGGAVRQKGLRASQSTVNALGRVDCMARVGVWVVHLWEVVAVHVDDGWRSPALACNHCSSWLTTHSARLLDSLAPSCDLWLKW